MSIEEYMALDSKDFKAATAAIIEAYFKEQESSGAGLQIDDEICHKAIETWGEDMLNVFMEEPAELIQAISKMRRKTMNGGAVNNGGQLRNLTEEIADVNIILAELMLYYNISASDVQKWIDCKQARTMRRIIQREEETQK
jgi:NTP pyrophosphatase (non-canonical NTP hydrolase)